MYIWEILVDPNPNPICAFILVTAVKTHCCWYLNAQNCGNYIPVIEHNVSCLRSQHCVVCEHVYIHVVIHLLNHINF